MQGSPARAAARAGPEWRVDVPVAVQVADAVEGPGRCLDAEAFQLLPGVWHQPFTTGFVYGSAAPVDDDDLESRPGAVQCGGQSVASQGAYTTDVHATNHTDCVARAGSAGGLRECIPRYRSELHVCDVFTIPDRLDAGVMIAAGGCDRLVIHRWSSAGDTNSTSLHTNPRRWHRAGRCRWSRC